MTSSSAFNNHYISTLHYWYNKGIRSVPAIHRETNIPLRAIYYNIKKLKQSTSIKHQGGNGRPYVLSGIEKKAVGEYIRRDYRITVKEVKEKLSTVYLYQQYVGKKENPKILMN